MKRVLSGAVILSLAVAGSALGNPRDDDEKAEASDPLPRANKVEWNVRVFEESPAFKVVKRQVKPNRVIWVLENKRNLGTEIIFGYQAALFDQDGVKVGAIGIDTEPSLLNMSRGERNRFILHLPSDTLKQVHKVVIKNGAYGG
jgi:hypothetical protein